MRLIVCKGCQRTIMADGEKVYCDECREKARGSTVMRTRVCKECGVKFTGGPRAWHCPDCRIERNKESSKRNKRIGTARPIGSTDNCTVCGAEYVVESGRQKYCPKCKENATAKAIAEHKKQLSPEARAVQKKNKDPGRRMRKVCIICGKNFYDGTPRVTCSPECDTERIKANRARAEAKRTGQPRRSKKNKE